MIQVVCPLDKTVHLADEIHAGKMLRCGTCGKPILILSSLHSTAVGVDVQPTPVLPVKMGGGILKVWLDRHTAIRIKSLLIAAAILGLGIFATTVWRGQAHKVASSSNEEVDRWKAIGAVSDPSTSLGAGSNLARSFSTGTRLSPDQQTYGLGVLTISNRSGSDAVVKLFSEESKRCIRTIFMQDDSELDIKSIPPGSYRVRFALGSDWDLYEKRFTQSSAFFEFGTTLVFTETALSDRTLYSQHTITLHTTPDGNVPRQSIDRGDFDRDSL